jgi:hypothetical protein
VEEKAKSVQTMQVRLLKKGHPNNTTFVLGGTGSGKTTLMANLMHDYPRWILFDTRNEYDPSFFDGEITVCDSIENFCESLNENKYKIIFKLPTEKEQSPYFESALLCIYQFQSSNKDNEELPPVVVVIDELNRFAETNYWPEALQEMIQRGRDFKIDKLFGAQWFGTIPTWCRDSFSEIYVFRHTDKNGLARLSDIGFDTEEVKNLPAYNCLYAGKNGIEKIRLIAANGDAKNQQTAKTG